MHVRRTTIVRTTSKILTAIPVGSLPENRFSLPYNRLTFKSNSMTIILQIIAIADEVIRVHIICCVLYTFPIPVLMTTTVGFY